MARDILSEYGPDAHKPQAAPAKSGGEKAARDVMNYCEPQGPLNRHHEGPGLHCDNHGNAFRPVAGKGDGGHAGIGGETHKGGSQRG